MAPDNNGGAKVRGGGMRRREGDRGAQGRCGDGGNKQSQSGAVEPRARARERFGNTETKPGLAPHLDVRSDLAGDFLQCGELGGGEGAGFKVDDAERADEAVFNFERDAGIEADVGLADDEGVVLCARILRCVGNDERVFGENRVGAESGIARRFGEAEPDGGFEPLTVGVDQADEGNGGVADLRGERGEVIEVRFGGGVEQPAFTEDGETFLFVVRQWCGWHVCS